jgi:hypothetical protein
MGPIHFTYLNWLIYLNKTGTGWAFQAALDSQTEAITDHQVYSFMEEAVMASYRLIHNSTICGKIDLILSDWRECDRISGEEYAKLRSLLTEMVHPTELLP